MKHEQKASDITPTGAERGTIMIYTSNKAQELSA